MARMPEHSGDSNGNEFTFRREGYHYGHSVYPVGSILEILAHKRCLGDQGAVEQRGVEAKYWFTLVCTSCHREGMIPTRDS